MGISYHKNSGAVLPVYFASQSTSAFRNFDVCTKICIVKQRSHTRTNVPCGAHSSEHSAGYGAWKVPYLDQFGQVAITLNVYPLSMCYAEQDIGSIKKTPFISLRYFWEIFEKPEKSIHNVNPASFLASPKLEEISIAATKHGRITLEILLEISNYQWNFLFRLCLTSATATTLDLFSQSCMDEKAKLVLDNLVLHRSGWRFVWIGMTIKFNLLFSSPFFKVWWSCPIDITLKETQQSSQFISMVW